jgi:hypothetical protein
MSSYVGPAQNLQYQLPFASEAVPSSFKSNLAPRPINCSLTTVVVPSTSGSASASGLSTIQVPLGNAAYIVNPYLRFKVVTTKAANTNGYVYKGAVASASALISSYQTTLNSTIIDNVTNADKVYDAILAHGTSADWLTRDGSVLMNTLTAVAADAATTDTAVYCIPLLGLLGSQQAFPAWACQGQLQINCNWNTVAGAFALSDEAGPQTNPITAFVISELSFVYDKITVESDFIGKMKGDMMSSNAKYVYNYTNYQNVTAPSVNGQNTINTGLNVSSLRGVVLSQVLTADLTSTAVVAKGYSLRNGLSAFVVTLDGRIINNSQLDAVNAPAVCFAEVQKCFNKVFDASVTDVSTKATYLTQSFIAGVSASRCAEGLSFQGSPVSVVGCQLTTAAATFTQFLIFISDYSLLIGADGQVDLVR